MAGSTFLFGVEGFNSTGWVDRYTAEINGTDGPRLMLPPECFHNVSSLYGSGTMIWRFFIVISVVVSWFLHPQQSQRDTVTNDLIAMVPFPIVAAAHFLHQNLTYDFNGDRRPLTSWYPEAVVFGASVESPLIVCEDFIEVGTYLFVRAYSRGQWKRASITLMPVLVWLSVVVFHFSSYPAASIIECNFYWGCHWDYYLDRLLRVSLTGATYYLDTKQETNREIQHLDPAITNDATISASETSPVRLDAENRCQDQRARTSYLWMAKKFFVAVFPSPFPNVLGWAMAAYTVSGLSETMHSLAWLHKLIPPTTASIGELDQVVAILGGVTALAFSVHAALVSIWKSIKPTEITRQPQWWRSGQLVTLVDDFP